MRAMRMATVFMSLLTLVLVTPVGADTEAGGGPAAPPRIEVCFVLDTTGSMGGLIAGAKAKIWSIANEMIAAKPTPELKIGLIGYRDRGDDYVTKVFDLTDDLDAMYAHLHAFQANGGGDMPESVNQALHEAVTKISWSDDQKVLKIIFLVGDSPPKMEYQDDVKYPQVCRLAMDKDLIINTVQCGTNGATTPIWQEIARLAEGGYVAIGQTGDMQIIETPVDAELAELNVKIGVTLVPYGKAAARESVMAKQSLAESAAPAAMADRLEYNYARGVAVQGGGDLVDAVNNDGVKLDEVAKEDLPAAMQEMTQAERAAYLKGKAAERARLQAQMEELLKRRKAYIDAELEKLSKAGKGNAFDQRVTELVREQAARKGIKYADERDDGS